MSNLQQCLTYNKLLYISSKDINMINYLLSIPKTYLFALLSGFSWALTTILSKQYLLKVVTPIDLYIIRMGFGFPILAFLFVFLFSFDIIKKSNTNSNQNYLEYLLKIIKEKATVKLLTIFIIAIIAGFFGLYMFWRILEINNGSYSVAFVYPLTILFTTLISYFMFNEKISTPQTIGIGLVIAGLFMLNIKV